MLILSSKPEPAFAEEAGTLRPLIRYSLRFDDNVFGMRSHTPDSIAGEKNTKADFSQTFAAGLIANGKIGRQIFSGSLLLNRTRYDTYNRFDVDGRDLLAKWKWAIGNHIDGSLGINYSKGLTPLSEAAQVTSNVRTMQRNHFDAAWSFHPDWRVLSGFINYQIKYANALQQTSSREENQLNIGIEHLTRRGTTASLMLIHIDGSQFRLVNPNGSGLAGTYAQEEIRASLDWPVSGKSRIQFSVGRVARRPDDIRIPEFNGINARITGLWEASAKLSMIGSAWREVAVIDDLRVNVPSLNTGASLVSRWRISEKSSTELTARYEQLDFKRSLSPSVADIREHTDSIKTILLGFTYRPMRNLTVQATLFHRRREYGLQDGAVIKNGMSITVQQVF